MSSWIEVCAPRTPPHCSSLLLGSSSSRRCRYEIFTDTDVSSSPARAPPVATGSSPARAPSAALTFAQRTIPPLRHEHRHEFLPASATCATTSSQHEICSFFPARSPGPVRSFHTTTIGEELRRSHDRRTGQGRERQEHGDHHI
jgi:hypothetical protein